MKLTATTLFVLLVAITAFAGPPLDGTYKSTDIGGPVETGRYTEAFVSPGGNVDIGTTLNAESWDGATLGLQWRYWCSSITVAPILISDNVNGLGNGFRIYKKVFTGGYLWLSGSGPWANGDADYPGVIDTYEEIETIQYVEWERVHAVTNVSAIGHFDSYPDMCMTFYVGNGLEINSTDFGMMKPGDFPDFLAQGTCAATGVYGGWWEFDELSLVITGCSVPAEDTTWGAIKALYTD